MAGTEDSQAVFKESLEILENHLEVIEMYSADNGNIVVNGISEMNEVLIDGHTGNVLDEYCYL